MKLEDMHPDNQMLIKMIERGKENYISNDSKEGRDHFLFVLGNTIVLGLNQLKYKEERYSKLFDCIMEYLLSLKEEFSGNPYKDERRKNLIEC